MRLVKEFEVRKARKSAVTLVAKDETLVGLFPDADTEIVEKKKGRKTTRSRYKVLGREGEATFHFTFGPEGDVRFSKVCDGRIWKRLDGSLTFEAAGAKKTVVRIEMDGATKALVPEFTIKGPMQEQIEQMAAALRERLEEA
jgi:hypothetical protein